MAKAAEEAEKIMKEARAKADALLVEAQKNVDKLKSLQGLAALLLTALIPGFLLVDALVGQSDTPPTTWERTLYSVAAGYAAAILGMLGLSYLPGSLAQWQTFALFDSLIIVLALIIVWQDRRAPRSLPDPAIFEDADLQLSKQHWLLAGILVLLLTGAFFRFTNLGYSEYQGDEARAAERAAAIIQGYDDVLMLHKKGPTEILLPTAVYSLTGHLTETTARLPFAIANLAALFAVFLLGWRFFNPLTGWIAAMFFALDGYFIGFARIVQYQSVVFLTSILVVLILYRLVQQPRNFTRYFTLASILLATGLLSHYEAALVVIPAVFLLGVLLWQNRSRVVADPDRHADRRRGGRCHAGRLLRALRAPPPLSGHLHLPDRPAHRRQLSLQQSGRLLPAHHGLQHHLLRGAADRLHDRGADPRLLAWAGSHLGHWCSVRSSCR